MTADSFDTDLAPELTEEAIEEARDLIGTKLRTDERGVRRRHCWNTTATADNIRQFARSAGDDNPLFSSKQYAEQTNRGEMIAPPTWLYTVDRTIVAPKLAGIQWIYGGTRFEYNRPVRVGDQFSVEVVPTKVERKSGKRTKDMVLQEGEVDYINQDDEVVATATGRCLRIPRTHSEGEESSVSQDREPKYWSEEELKELEERILGQTKRGDEPRYWSTVSEGDELEPRLKGPLAITDMLCWYSGYGTPVYFPHEIGVKERRRHPSEAYRREDLGIFEHPAMGHLDSKVARGIGVPRPYDIGPQRITWLSQTVTDWIGDNAWVKMLDSRVEGMNYLGDLTTCTGEVTNTYIDEETGEHLVDIELSAENQADVQTATGEATVVLPTE